MVVLGIDPGTRRVGYGVIKKASGKLDCIDAGLLKIESRDDLGALREIKTGITKLIKRFRPDVLAVEKLYFAKNQKTAMQVAQARGVILLAAIEAGVKVEEYSPNEVKAGISGYGLADKKAVLKMVKLILCRPDLDVIDDASDALAVAILSTGRSPIDKTSG